ncbi:MAG: hypothetical protein WAR42_09070, partial [Limnochordia bacterium]
SIFVPVLVYYRGSEGCVVQGTVSSVAEIEHFLSSVRKEMANPKRTHLISRAKNLRDIARLGLNWKHEVLSLTYRDYDRGPLPDDSGVGDVWEFIPTIDGTMVYIKLKLDPARGVVCLSFHESTGPWTLPYRDARRGND